MARTRAKLTNLEWNLDEGTITASIYSYSDQEIKISCPVGSGYFITSSGERYANNSVIKFKKGEEINIRVIM